MGDHRKMANYIRKTRNEILEDYGIPFRCISTV